MFKIRFDTATSRTKTTKRDVTISRKTYSSEMLKKQEKQNYSGNYSVIPALSSSDHLTLSTILNPLVLHHLLYHLNSSLLWTSLVLSYIHFLIFI